MIGIILLFSSVVAILVYYIHDFKKYNRHLDKLPGPTYIPFFGSKLVFCSREDILSRIQEYFEEYNGSFLARIGPIRPVVFVGDVKTIEFMMSSTKYIDKSIEYKFLSNWLKNGLLTATGSYWRKHRKIITPAFHFSILEGFVTTFEAQTKTLIRKLKNEVGVSSFDIFPYLTLCSLDIITGKPFKPNETPKPLYKFVETSMGSSVNAQNHTSSDYVKALRTVIGIMVDRTFSPVKMYDVFYQFTSASKKEKYALNVLHGYSRKVIQNRKKLLEGKKMDQIDEFGNKIRYAFLDLMLSKGSDGEQILTDEEIMEEVDTLLFEGHDTTATAISFTLYCIAAYPEVQQRLLEELKEVYKDDFLRDTTYQDLSKMHYLDLVIKETLRLYPAVPIYGRLLQEDIEIGGQIYPKGCTFTFSMYGLHRDPKNFPNPEKFDPTRFAGNRVKPYTYLPFSAGSRNCIGQRYATAEIKTVVSRVVRHYEFFEASPKHQLKVMFDGVLKSTTGLHLQIKERKLA